MLGKETEGRLSNNEVLEEIRILGNKDKDNEYKGCWFDKNMKPRKVNVEADKIQNYLRITPDEGELLEFD